MDPTWASTVVSCGLTLITTIVAVWLAHRSGKMAYKRDARIELYINITNVYECYMRGYALKSLYRGKVFHEPYAGYKSQFDAALGSLEISIRKAEIYKWSKALWHKLDNIKKASVNMREVVTAILAVSPPCKKVTAVQVLTAHNEFKKLCEPFLKKVENSSR